jgi:hypothetical protein
VKKLLLLLSLSVFEPFSGPTDMDCEVVDMASFFLPLWLLRATGGRKKERERERMRESPLSFLSCAPTHSSVV